MGDTGSAAKNWMASNAALVSSSISAISHAKNVCYSLPLDRRKNRTLYSPAFSRTFSTPRVAAGYWPLLEPTGAGDLIAKRNAI